MKSMHLLLDEAERSWRGEVQNDFPLRADTPVLRDTKQNGRDWTFSTDLRRIFAHIGNDERLQERFRTVIAKYWDGTPEDLARETFHYLLFHELYHPLEAPFSVTGENNDNKRIHQAIRKGVLKAEPKLTPLEQIVKVQSSQNGVKDFILDNRFYLDNKEKGYVRSDIIPTWDVMELEATEPKTNFYTITRLLYGLFYGPKTTHPFFQEKAGKKGESLAKKAVSAVLEKKVEFPKEEGALVRKAKRLLRIKGEGKDVLSGYGKDLRAVFSGEDRYNGIERFMGVLGPYVEKDMPAGRPDMQGEASGCSPQNILQDLLDDMNQEQQQAFVQGLAAEDPQSLQQEASSLQNSSTVKSSAATEMENLDVLAVHEYYKRNHPKVKIVGGKKSGETVIVGKREYWNLKSSTLLTTDQLSRINLQRIGTIQRKTGLPWLIDLQNGTFRLDEYEPKERNVKGVAYVDTHLDVPDFVDFYLDSSGSMGTSNFKVNDGSRWDMLTNVVYGFVDGLYQAGKQVKKQTAITIHNAADTQVTSERLSAEEFWNGNIPALNTLFRPNNGYNSEALNIYEYNDKKKRAYVVASDGELVTHTTEQEARKMKSLAKNKNNAVVLFEIGGTYGLGNAVSNDPNISYYQVHNKEEMLQRGLEVLLAK